MNLWDSIVKGFIVVFTALSALFSVPTATPQRINIAQNEPPAVTQSTTTARATALPLEEHTASGIQPITTTPRQSQKALATTPLLKVATSSNGDVAPLDALSIIMITNEERAKTGAAPLTFNAKLSEAAMAKAKDMIAKQYFAHKSPDGVNVSDLAKLHGYDYSLVGENLALGDFKNSRDVMDGWMNSPGHRANILKPTYTEIGVAAIKGPYEGRDVWYAVQEFGRPPPNCVLPDATMELSIKNSEATMDTLSNELTALKQKIDAQMGNRDEINAMIAQYNALASQHNDLLNSLKGVISTYNGQVASYNACIAKEEAIIGPPSSNTE